MITLSGFYCTTTIRANLELFFLNKNVFFLFNLKEVPRTNLWLESRKCFEGKFLKQFHLKLKKNIGACTAEILYEASNLILRLICSDILFSLRAIQIICYTIIGTSYRFKKTPYDLKAFKVFIKKRKYLSKQEGATSGPRRLGFKL